MSLRWGDPVYAHDTESGQAAVDTLWRAAIRNSARILYCLGVGFDPRALVGVRRFLGLEDSMTHLTILGIQPSIGSDGSSPRDLANHNNDDLEAIVAARGCEFVALPQPTVEEPSSSGLRLGRHVVSQDWFTDADAVIVDISAMPTDVYFPLIGAVLAWIDSTETSAEFLVVACDNPDLDQAIRDEGVNPASSVGGFKNGLDVDGTQPSTRIWAPVIGRGEGATLSALHAWLNPREIVPVLPFPARRARRPDDLILEHHQLLFEEMEVEPRNVIYANEGNPFDLYRTLSRLDERYSESLAPIGETTLVVSTHSSKVLSLGVVLAAYERRLPVVNAPPTSYTLDSELDIKEISAGNQMACLWLSGTPYRNATQ